MEQQRSKPLQWLNLVISEPYYTFHFMTFFSYLVIRSSTNLILDPQITNYLLHREIQALLALALLAAIKVVKEETWEALIADMLFFTKICLFALAFAMDRCLAAWYIVVFLVIYMLTQQPPFQKLGTSHKLTPLQLESLLTEGNTSRFWLVEFRASNSSACIRSSQCFPELSVTFRQAEFNERGHICPNTKYESALPSQILKYSNKNLSFGIVDLGLFPNAAEKFGISLSGSMAQLPTFILFENAAEVARFPELDFEAKFFNPTLTRRFLSRHFELDRHLLAYVNGK